VGGGFDPPHPCGEAWRFALFFGLGLLFGFGFALLSTSLPMGYLVRRLYTHPKEDTAIVAGDIKSIGVAEGV
jgi:hypothetical protein